MQTLAKLLKSFTHFSFKVIHAKGFVLLYTIDDCEVCGCDVTGANPIQVYGVKRADLAKLTERDDVPDQGGYSEIHGCTTCLSCNDDKDARKKHANTIHGVQSFDPMAGSLSDL